MTIFAMCLLGAGAVLSLITRVHGLILVACGVVVASMAVAMFRWLQAAPGPSLGITLAVAIVTLQVGYGAGIVARAILGSRPRGASAPAARTPDPDQAKQPVRRES